MKKIIFWLERRNGGSIPSLIDKILLCVSSHFCPFTKANLVLENFNKKLGFGQTPPPLVGLNAQLFPKMHFEGPPNIIKIDHLVDDFSKNATC